MSFESILKYTEEIEDKTEFFNLLTKVSDSYYNSSSPSITDSQFDSLVSVYEKRFNTEYTYIGSRGDIKLPVYMPSLNKVKDNHALELYKKRCDSSSYIISDKIDGISLLIVVKDGYVKLYTRGDGEYGKDVSNIFKYIDIGSSSILKKDHIVRGEIIMPLDKFKKYSSKFNNPRNLVAGAINSKEKNTSLLKDLKFIAYSYCDNDHIKETDEAFNTLKSMGYYTPHFETSKVITEEYLRELLNKRKVNANYEIDGLVISGKKYLYENSKDNPKMTVAFKSLGETKEVKVLDVEWNVRKYNYLKPRVRTEPVFFGNVKVQYFSGYNAKYIKDNNIGVDTVLLVTRSGDVVPDILEVINSTEALLPNIKCHWEGIELVSDEDTTDINLINRLVSFFTICDIKGMKEGIIKKIIESKAIKDDVMFFNISKEDILSIDGFKDKSADNVLNCIKELKVKMTLPYIMIGSCIFQGFGEKKINKIINGVNDVSKYITTDNSIDKDEMIRNILNIGGFNTTAKKFVDSLDEFKEYFNKVKTVFENATLKEDLPSKNEGRVYCFSGFRDNELKKRLQDEGNIVSDTLTKEVNILIVKDINDTSSKVEKAKKYGIEIVELKYI